MATSNRSASKKGGRKALFFALEPVPASRPRVTRWGTYHTPKYKQFLKDANECLMSLKAPTRIPKDHHIRVTLDFRCTRARTSKLTRPHGDVDNYAKAVLDAITHSERIWHDDVQVVALNCTKQWATEDYPRGISVHIEHFKP